MNNIPGLVDEPYMDARSDYLQKVIFQLSGFVTKRFDGGLKYQNGLKWCTACSRFIQTKLIRCSWVLIQKNQGAH